METHLLSLLSNIYTAVD